MNTNSYEYNGYYPSASRDPQQQQLVTGRYVNAPASQQHSLAPQQQKPQTSGGAQKPKPPVRMPKARAMDLARTLKKWIVIASLASFSAFGGLAAFHQIGTATAQSSSTTTQKTTSTNSSSSQSNNGFFKQQGGTNLGSTSPTPTPTSTSSGSNNSSPSANNGSNNSGSAPVSGSSVSQSH